MSKADDKDCDLCMTNVTKLGAFLMTDQVINATVVSFNRVVYDRVRKRKNYFEIPAFLQIERGKSRAGKFKTSNENKNKNKNVFIYVFI